MKKIIVAGLMLFSGMAFADANCVGNNPCSTNGGNPITNNNTSVGTGVGFGGSSNATGGSVNNSGNSSSSSNGVGVGVANANGGNANATNSSSNSNSVVSNNTVRNDNAVVGVNSSSNNVKQSQNTDNANNSKQSTNVTVEGDKYDAARIPPSSAIAPTMFATAMCQAARAGAFQNSVFGISLGGTITDENCIRLEQLRVVGNIVKDPETISAMACLASPLYRQARKDLGLECKADLVAPAKTIGQP